MGKMLPSVTNYDIELPFVALCGHMWPCIIFCGRECVTLLSCMALVVWTCMAFLWSFIAKYQFCGLVSSFPAIIDPNSLVLLNLDFHSSELSLT